MRWSVVVEKDGDYVWVRLLVTQTNDDADGAIVVLEWWTGSKDNVDVPELITRFISAVPTEALLIFSTTIADLNSGKRMLRAKSGYKRVVWESPHVP